MKKLFSIPRMLLILLGASFLFLYSCKKSSDPTPVVLLPKLEGFYVYGSATVATAPTDAAARMNLAVLDTTQGSGAKNTPGYYGKFMYIGANSTINFAQVVGAVGTHYGAENGGATDSTTTVGNMTGKDFTIHGTLKADAEAIKVADAGLYYVMIVATSADPTFTITRVRTNIIGDATPGGWTTSTDLTEVSSSLDSTAWEITGLNLLATNGYKYRLPKGGWQFYSDVTNVVTLSSLAVKDYGVSWAADHNDIGLFNSNIPTQVTGSYKLRVTYIAATDSWVEKKVKTGEFLVDYSGYHLGLWGNAFVIPGSDPADTAAWNIPYSNDLPVVTNSGKVFTWTWNNVNLIEGNEFIFIKDGSWGGGLILDATGCTEDGNAAADKVKLNADSKNFHVYTKGAYDLKLVFDNSASPPTKNVTINTH